MDFVGIRNLCAPAKFYLVISMFAIVIILVQSLTSSNVYCVGNYSCDATNVYIVFLLKTLYILFWTWLLNIICRSGMPMVSWFLVLMPFILMFILIAMFLIFSSTVPTSFELF
jgi:hypothetical protein